MKFYKRAMVIDSIIAKLTPDQNDIVKLTNLLNDNPLKNYFWRNIKNELWLLPLKEAGFFEILSQNSTYKNELIQTQSFVSEYLLNVAKKYPKEVIEIIKSSKSDNDRVIWSFIRIGLVLDGNETAKLINDVTKWISKLKVKLTLFDSEIIGWIKHLTEENQFDAAFELLKILTTPKIQKPIGKRNKEIEKIIGRERPKAKSVLDSYYLKELLSKELGKLIEHDILQLSQVLQKSLEQSLRIEYGSIKGSFDFSISWRAAIEDHSQNYSFGDLTASLLVALRNSLEELVKKDKDIGLRIIKEFLTHNFSIFRRLAVHLLRLNYDNYALFIRNFIKSKNLLKETDISHEYYLLLKEIFPKLEASEKRYLINSIREIKSFDKKDEPEIQKKQIRFNHLKKLHYFENHIEGEDLIYYSELKIEFSGEKIRDTVSWHESYSGRKSPLTYDEIYGKPITELWEYFKSFRKNKQGFDTPSVEGLAILFGTVVKKNPEKYLVVDLTPLIELNPTYSYWFLNSVTELYKSEKYRDLIPYISTLLNFINKIIRVENIPEKFTEEMDINFVGVKRRALDLIQALIATHQSVFEIKYNDIIWEIISYLSYYKEDPNDARETESNMDPYTIAINSVRGMAVISVVDFGLWYAFNNKKLHTDAPNPDRFLGEERVRELLEDKLLNKKDDSSTSIHSIFGVYLANLAYLNFDWMKAMVKYIFPSDNEKYWVAAWGGFINSSRFYSDIFKLLKPHFQKALTYLQEGNKRIPSGFGRSPEDALSEHLIIACLNGLDDINKKNSLLRKFAYTKNNPSAEHAAQFIANLAKDERIFYDDPSSNDKSFWPQAHIYWQIRIKVVKSQLKERNSKNKVEDEIDREFSLFINWVDYLPSEISLKELEPLLLDTLKINYKGWHLPDFIDYLKAQSDKYPLIALRLLGKLMLTDAPDYFYHSKNEEIIYILTKAINTGDPKALRNADIIANKFGEWGDYFLKDFWKKHLQ